MKNNLSFEWLKLKKSKVLLIVVIVFVSLFGVFTITEFSEQRKGAENQAYYYNQLLKDTKKNLKILKENDASFSQQNESTDEIENLPDHTKLEIEYLEHILPYVEQVVKAYHDKNYLTFYQAQLDYIPEKTKRADYIYGGADDQSLEEMEARFDADTSKEYTLMETFLSVQEPLELEGASTADFNFVVQTLQFFRQPLLLAIMIIVANLVLIEEVTEGSFSFMLLESKSRAKWFSASILLVVMVFFGLIFVAIFVAYLIAKAFGEPIFMEAPSWYAPVTYRNEILPDLYLGRYFLINLLTLFMSFIFSHSIFRALLAIIKNSLFSSISFLITIVGGYYLTSTFAVFQSWWNPWSLFLVENLLVEGNLYILLLNYLIVTFFSLILYRYAFKKGRWAF